MRRPRRSPHWRFSPGAEKRTSPEGGRRERNRGREPAEEISVAVAPALRTAIPRKIEFVGSLAGAEQVTLSSEVEGTVETVRNDLGDPVRKAQVLVSLVRTSFCSGKSRRARRIDQVSARLGIPPGDRRRGHRKNVAGPQGAGGVRQRAEGSRAPEGPGREEPDRDEGRGRRRRAVPGGRGQRPGRARGGEQSPCHLAGQKAALAIAEKACATRG